MPKNFKHIIEEIKLIEELCKTQRFKVKIQKKSDIISGYLRKMKPKGFMLEVSSLDSVSPNIADSLKASITNKRFNLEVLDSYLAVENFSYSTKLHRYKSKIHIKSFQGKTFSKDQEKYYRNVMPVETDLSVYYILQDEPFMHDGGVKTRGLMEIEINSNLFDVFILEVKKKKYLVIDCINKMSLPDFHEYCWSVTVALGYVTGHLIQNDVYTFSYRNKSLKGFFNFTYSQRRNSIISLYKPVYTNPHGWIKSDKKIVEKYCGKINPINPLQMSKLCKMINNEIDIKAIVLLIIEFLCSSLLLMPAGLSVALEGLSEYFSTKNLEKINPISNKKLSKKFREDLIYVLDKYKTDPNFSGYEIMKNKILAINSPTTREKLKSPFTFLNISLNETDEQILQYRNDFLHGNINLKPRKGKKLYTMDSYEISLRLLTLLNMILMKMIGYEGYIVNHVKVQEWGLGKKINEEYYRKI